MDLEAQAIRRIHLAAELSAAYYQKPDHSGRSGNHLSRSKRVSSTGVGGYCLRFPQTPLPKKTHQYVELDCPEGLAPHPETAVLLPSSKRERRAAPGGGAGRPGRGESKQEGLRRGGAAG